MMKFKITSIIIIVLVIFYLVSCSFYKKNQVNCTNSYSFLSVDSLPENEYFPDPFKKYDGSKVAEMSEWPCQREYLKEILYYYLWGTIPPKPTFKDLSYTLVSDTDFVIPSSEVSALKLIYKATIIRNSKSLSFDIAVWRPVEIKRYPTLIQNFRALENHPYAGEEAIKRGYIFVQYNRTQVAPDDPLNTDRQQGIFPLYPEYSFGTIAAWAWTAQLVIDILDDLGILDMDGYFGSICASVFGVVSASDSGPNCAII